MKKILSLLLLLALALGLAPDAWYAPYVDYVSRYGIMVGTGDGQFEPNRELTEPECLTLALRLYARMCSCNAFAAAPYNWVGSRSPRRTAL